MGSILDRPSGMAMMLSGAVFIATGAPYVTNPPAWSLPFSVERVMLLAGYALLAVGLLGLHRLQVGRDGMLGRIGAWLEVVGLMAALVAVTASLAGLDLEWLHGSGIVLAVVGMLLAGIATIRAGVLPGWSGGALVAAALLTFFPVEYSIVLLGLAVLPLGHALWKRAGQSRPVASSV